MNEVPESGWRRLRMRIVSAWLRGVAALRGGSGAASGPAAAPVDAGSAFADSDRYVEQELLETGPGPLIDIGPPTEAPTPWPLGEAAGGFTGGSFTNAAGTRPYRLFVPAGYATTRPLIVMLHGCRQDPDDFAAGTRMNALAQKHGIMVLYPGQIAKANQLRCWNWFRAENQERDRGEPSIIADLTRHIMEAQHIDPRHVYIAGLSAGGALAAVMAATYPDLYAAVGIHSGLPHAAANNLATALSAMRHGPAGHANVARTRGDRQPVPTIVFHGDEDTTVHPDNADEVIVQARWGREAEEDRVDGSGMTVEQGEVSGGRSYTRTLHRDAEGRCDAEHWLVHGSGHAWSGGSADGSYTDPLGPDASAQMLRFFLEHPRRG